MASAESRELEAIREAAAAWVIRLAEARESGVPGAAADSETEFQAWLAADERHAATFRQIQQLWEALEQPAAPPVAPRRPWRSGVVLAICLSLGLAVQQQHWLADARTGVGEVRLLTLEDGSRLTLDSASAVDIDYSGGQRRVRLLAGRIIAQVEKDGAGRPFVVVSDDGSAQAMGTRYVVDRSGQGTLVSVVESTVAVSPARGRGRVLLGPGQAVRLEDGDLGTPEAAAAVPDSWEQHRLVFDDVPLAQVLERLDRYFPGVILAGDEVKGLRFTGALPTDDVDKALRLLTQTLSLRTEKTTPWVVRIKE